MLAAGLLSLALLATQDVWHQRWVDIDSGQMNNARRAELKDFVFDCWPSFQTRLLGFHMGVCEGKLPVEELPERYEPLEAWMTAQVLEPGPERTQLFLVAIEEVDDAGLQPRLNILYEAMVADADAWRMREAEALALALHERTQATWSAISLALLSTRMGQDARADRVLGRQIEATSVSAERTALLSQRAISALGAGREAACRDHLGRAIQAGSKDAVQILALLEFGAARYDRARRLFGTLLLPDPDGSEEPLEAVPWALRGYGLALLESAREPVAPAGPPTTRR